MLASVLELVYALHGVILAVTGLALLRLIRVVIPVLAFAVIGAAISVSKNFPRWLGLWGVFGGTLCFITGFGSGLHLSVPLPIWIAGVTMAATWGIPLGVMMWRASSRQDS